MKKIFIITTLIFVAFAAAVGFSIGVASRFAIFDIFFSLTPTAPLIQEANILLLGADGSNELGHRSDTVMVLHINSEKKEASVISIPRDTLAVIPGRGLDKINHAFAYGGAELSRQTVEGLLHISIPYYVVVNLSGIESLIDDIGGVTINVEKRMYYIDYAGGLDIDLKPGVQKLNGKQVMGYLRFRHTDGDFARIGRQQNFLKDLASELMKKDNLLKSPNAFLQLLSCVETNLNSREILGLTLTMRGAYELGQVYMTMIPGTDLMLDKIYYWKPDVAAVQRIVEQFINGKRLASSG
jgi:LCP family protein required for cell wall assembly